MVDVGGDAGIGGRPPAVVSRANLNRVTAQRELTPDEIAQRDAMIDELTTLSAVLARVDAMHLRRGELYENLKGLGVTRRDLAAIAGISTVTVDWGSKRWKDHQAGVPTSTARRHRRPAAAGSSGSNGAAAAG